MMQISSGGAARVQVIVPVYKGFEETVTCIEHLLDSRSTNRVSFEVIVIDDCSPEQRISFWLHDQAAKLGFRLLRNEVNLGFVLTVNRGMQLSSTDDIVLLNSDTVVAGDWLDRLQRCAYSERNIGTVTPFSNNAEICSYPKFCAPNSLAEGMDVKALHSVFSGINDGMHVDIPTGVGFCLYIRRKVLATVGMFDAETFGRGYGEENDFCMRIIERGWRNVLACDVFVGHIGAVSFDETANPAKQRAQELIDDLHPAYHMIINKFIREDPIKPYRLRADIERLRNSKLPTILFISHNRGGGTQKHIDELTEILDGKANCLEIQPEAGEIIALRWISKAEAFKIRIDVAKNYDFLLDVCRVINISRVHFHHTMGLPTRLWALPGDLKVEFDFTIHDYYAACPQISLTRDDNRYCEERGVIDCYNCLRKNPAPGKVPIDMWRANNGDLLKQAARVIAPSLDVEARIRRYFPEAKLVHMPHPERDLRVHVDGTGVRFVANGRPLRIAVLGALSQIKGADLLERCAIDARKRNQPLEFQLIGYSYRQLARYPKAKLNVHGEYDDRDLSEIIRHYEPDLIWFPALWPETYSYTLSVALKEGYPILAPNLGAFPERLAGRRNAWVYAWDTEAHEINDMLCRMFLGLGEDSCSKVWQVEKKGIFSNAIDFFPAEEFVRNYLKPLEEKVLCEAGWPCALEISKLADVGYEETMSSQFRHALVSILYKMRSSAVMRPVARVISGNLQRRVKNWILNQ